MFESLRKAKPSMEDAGIISSHGEVDRGYASEGCVRAITGSVCDGIVRSLAMYLRSKGLDKPTILTKINELVNQMVDNKDISENMKKWIFTYDILNEREYCPSIWNIGSMCDCSLYYSVYSAARSGVICETSWADQELKSKMTDKEKAIIEDLKNAREAYYSATAAYEKYVTNQAVLILDEIITKYTELLHRISKDWTENIVKMYKDQLARVKEEMGKDEKSLTSKSSDTETSTEEDS